MTEVYTTSRLLLRTDYTAQGTLLRALWRPKWEGIQKRRDTVGDTEDAGSIPGSEKSPEEGNGNPLPFSCLENPTDRGAWRVTAQGVAKHQTQYSK